MTCWFVNIKIEEALLNKLIYNIYDQMIFYLGDRWHFQEGKKSQNLAKLLVFLHGTKPFIYISCQALKAAGQIWLLSNFDSQEDIAYPNDPRVPIKVDDDIKQLFRGIELPRDMIDIEKDLQKNGMKPATNTAKRRSTAQIQGIPSKPKTKKKKNEISKRTKLTNAHLPELFQNLNAS